MMVVIMVMVRGSSSAVAKKKTPSRRRSPGGLMSPPAPHPPTLHPPFAQQRSLFSSSPFFLILFAEKALNSFPHHPCPETPGAARLHDFYEGGGGRFVRGEGNPSYQSPTNLSTLHPTALKLV